MNINDNVLTKEEKTIFALRELYLSRGFVPYRMGKFEEYDLYAENKDFLVSDNVITFTGANGKLMALKPDVTLSIIKNTAEDGAEVKKVFYNENVYRISKSTGAFKEIMQVGAELFGNIDEAGVTEMLETALESLQTVSKDTVLAVSDLSVLSRVIEAVGLRQDEAKTVFNAVSEKNTGLIRALCGDKGETLLQLLACGGKTEEALPRLDSLLKDMPEYIYFKKALTGLKRLGECVRIDFSVTGDTSYYNGIVFKGFMQGVPTPIMSGGKYDNLMKRLGRRGKAIGFAIYTDELEAAVPDTNENDGFLNIALPKGRLGERVYGMLERAGYECPSLLEPNRKLIFENAEKRVRYFWVKPSDVAIYVERGAADIGVCGKDILAEYEPDVYELLDLNTGVCRMAVAAPKGFTYNGKKTVRVATKFSNIARGFYQSRGQDIDIIHLNGSIEIAPILGLSDVIVDIVETGATLRENNLEVVEEILPISARLIANKASEKFKGVQIDGLVKELRRTLLKGE